ncbi:hypothetical protein VTK56DRAFT_3792 [Thermocarpiscus australiensis]
MTVCRFYQQGYCRNGNACKFEHPPKGGQQNYNRFGALAGQTNQGPNTRADDTPQYAGLTADAIQRDLANELPQWILSCYGPGRDAPEQLFGGYPREQSFEEIRLHYLQGVMAGNPQAALNDIQALYQTAQQQIQHALSNIPAAIQFVLDGAKKHPNRIDICKGATGEGAFGSTTNAFQNTAAQPSPFGAPAAPAPAAPAPAAGAFGQPAALGQQPGPFGRPPAQPAASTSAFGQPSALGGASPFGRPAQATGAFGQTSTLGAKPSPFGAPAFGQPAQPAQPAGTPAFGQPAQSAFGQPAALGTKPNPFGAPAAGPSPFAAQQGGASSTQPVTNPFGQPTTSAPFGQPAAAPVNPFGQPQQQPAPSPFGGPAASAAPTTAFGQPATASPFGQPATAAPGSATHPFGQPSTAASPFGGGATAAAAKKPAEAQGQGPYGPNASRQHPDISSYSSRGPDGLLRMFKGRPVSYETPKDGGKPVPVIRNFDGTLTKIWMPNGAPSYTSETEAEPAKYEDPGVLQRWKAFMDSGRFADGIMPEVPPKREFCTWDF